MGVTEAQNQPRPVPRTPPGRRGVPVEALPSLADRDPRPKQAVAGQEVLRGLSSWPPREPVPALPPTHTRYPPSA